MLERDQILSCLENYICIIFFYLRHFNAKLNALFVKGFNVKIKQDNPERIAYVS